MNNKILFICLLGLVACQKKADTTLPGYVEADYIRISVPASGFLKQQMVTEGDQIPSGTPLFVIESEEISANARQLKAQLDKSEAELADLQKGKRPAELDALDAQISAAKAALTYSEQDLHRQQQLRKQGFSNQAALDQATSAFKQAKNSVDNLTAQRSLATQSARQDQLTAAKAAVAAANEQYTKAQWYVNQLTPQSPRASEVSEVYFQTGEWVAAGTPVVSLLSPELLKIRFYLPEKQRATISAGQAIQIQCDGCNKPIAAHIRYIANQAEFTPPVIYSKENRANLVFLVEARPDDPQQFNLRPGQPIAVDLQLPEGQS